MIKTKTNFSWSVISTLFVVTSIYILAALTMLQSNNANIDFIEKEQQGVQDYKSASSLYFELYQTQHPDEVMNHMAQVSGVHYTAVWHDAVMAAQNARTLAEKAHVLRNLIRDIGDQSNLILDPALESYYAVTITFNRLPALITRIQSEKNVGDTADISEALDHAAAIVAQRALTGGGKLTKNVAAIEESLNSFNPATATLRQKTAYQSAIVQQSIELSQTTVQILEDFLRQRLADERGHRMTSMSVMLVIYMALVFLCLSAVRNYVYQREIQSMRERQGLMEKLEQKNDELESFTYAAAHDIKEPIRTMRCFATLLKQEAGALLNASADDYLKIIDNAAAHAEQMINDLLNYARLSGDSIELEETDTAQEVKAALEDVKSLVESTHPVIHVDNLPVIATVPSLFRRVMQNLIDNAIKYHKPGIAPDIRISATRQEKDWLFCVQDKGIGIDASNIKSIFDPFRRLYVKADSAGHGLGLTSCKKIIELLGGKIWAQSEPGAGSSFYFTLPFVSL